MSAVENHSEESEQFSKEVRDFFAPFIGGYGQPIHPKQLAYEAGCSQALISLVANGKQVRVLNMIWAAMRMSPEFAAAFNAKAGYLTTPLYAAQGHECEMAVTAESAEFTAYATMAAVDGFTHKERVTLRMKARRLMTRLGLYDAAHAKAIRA